MALTIPFHLGLESNLGYSMLSHSGSELLTGTACCWVCWKQSHWDLASRTAFAMA